jgi:hypothetical protein
MICDGLLTVVWDDLPLTLALALMLSLIALPFVMAGWVLIPLDRAARYRARAMQFTTLDFLGLMFVIQLPLGLLHLALPPDYKAALWLLGPMGMVTSGAIWLAGVRMLSRAGITAPQHRARLVFFVLPVAYFAPLVAIALPMIMFDAAVAAPTRSGAALVLAETSLFAALWWAGRVARRVLAATALSEPAIDSRMRPWK